MSAFQRDRPHRYTRMVTLRVTEAQKQNLTELAARLGLGGEADVLRAALDYWLANAPELQRPAGRRRRQP